MPDKKHQHFMKFRDILDRLFDGDRAGDDVEEFPHHELGKHITDLRRQGMIFFERINYGHDGEGDALLATVVGDTMIPDFEFIFCDDMELVNRYGVETAVVAAYVKKRIRQVGSFMVDTRGGEITAAHPPIPEWFK